MKLAYAVLASLIFVAPAIAAPVTGGVCIDPHWSYRANWLKGHQIVAQRTIGTDHRQLLLDTTCYDMDRSDFVSLSTSFQCVGQGDDVIVSKLDGHRQRCRVTHVEPYTPPAGAPG